MKTISLKKVAVVAVASLGFGLLSVVPAQAAITNTSMYISKYSAETYSTSNLADTLDGATTAITEGAAGVILAADVGKSIYTLDDGWIGTIAAAPAGTTTTLAATPTTALAAAGNGAVGAAFLGTRASTVVANPIVSANQISGMSVTAGSTFALDVVGAGSAAGGQVQARITGTGIISAEIDNSTGATHYMVPMTAPLTPGTYPLVVTYSNSGLFNDVAADEVKLNFTLTVTANSAATYGSTAVTVASGTEDAAGTLYGAAAYSSTAVATFTVSQKDVTGTALATAYTQAMTASISGVGSLATVSAGATPSSVYQGYAAGTANGQTISVFGDGRAGTATVTIAVNGVTVSTKTVKLYGAVTKITATANYAIGRSGGYESGALTKAGTTNTAVTSGTNDGLQQAGSLTQTAIAVVLSDSAGNTVPALPTSVTSSNAAVLNTGITTSFIDNGTGDYSAGFGTVHMTYSTATSSKSGDSATLTISYQNAGGALVSATPITIKIGGVVAKETLSFDKTTYAAGDPMVITRAAVDASGNAVYDGAAAPSVSFSKAVGGTAPGVSVYVGGKKATSATVPTVFAPTSAGSFLATMTSNNAAGDTITATASVTDANAGLLTQIDALNAKIVALNALIAKIMKKLGVK